MNLVVAGQTELFAPAWRMAMAPGKTITQILRTAHVPAWFDAVGVVHIDGAEIDRRYWHLVRPLAETADGDPVVVSLHLPLPQGGDGGGKRILTLLATIALTVATAGIASGAFLGGLAASLGTAANITTTAASAILAAGVGIVGKMLIGAMTPPPVAANLSGAVAAAKAEAGIQGNVLAQLDQLPMVLGTIVFSPPHVVKPYTLLTGQDGDVIVCAVVGLAGEYEIEDVQINGLDITTLDTVDYETRVGGIGDSQITLNDDTCIETQPRETLINIELADPTNAAVADQGTPANSDPKWHYVKTAGEADEFSLRVLWPAGLAYQLSGGAVLANVPVRVECREVGSNTWLKLPEFHFAYTKKATSPFRREITFKWLTTSPATSALSANSSNQPRAYWSSSPGQGFARTAESYFNPGSGLLSRHVARTATGFECYLQTATFPKGAYEFRIQRGAAFNPANFTTSTYAYNSNVSQSNFFTSRNSSGTYVASGVQDQLADQCMLESAMTRTYDYPFGFVGGMALLSIQARGLQVNSISAKFTRVARVWDGTSWATKDGTRNPAALYRDVLTGRENPDRVSDSLLDPGVLEAWHDACASAGYECNAVIQGYSVGQALQLIAGAGWAVPKQNGLRSVIREYDRSSEPIVQKFTPLNSSNFAAALEFNDLPHALRIEFFDEADGYNLADTYVYADGYDHLSATRFEALREDGVTDRQKARDKGLLYLRQIYERRRRYTLDVAHEVLLSERGDLVGVSHDVLSEFYFFNLVKSVLSSGGNVTGLVLRSPIDMSFSTTATPGLSIRQKDGSMLFKRLQAYDGETDTVTFYTPFTDDGEIGRDCLVSVGKIGQEYRRCIIFGIEPKPDLSATLLLLDADLTWPIVAPAEEDPPGYNPGSAWEYVGASSPVTVSSGNITLTEPGNVEQGDLLVAVIAYSSNAAFTPPGSWVAAQSSNAASAGSVQQSSALMGYIVRGASAPGLTFTRTSGGVAHGRILAFRGAKQTTPLDDYEVKLVTGPSDNLPALTAADPDELIVFMASVTKQTNVPLGHQQPGLIVSTDPLIDEWVLRGYSTTDTGAGIGLNIVSAVKRTAGSTGMLNQTITSVLASHAMIAACFKGSNS